MTDAEFAAIFEEIAKDYRQGRLSAAQAVAEWEALSDHYCRQRAA